MTAIVTIVTVTQPNFSRQVGPGIHFIQSSLWLVIARVVATLDIKQKVVNGVPVEVNPKEKNAFFR